MKAFVNDNIPEMKEYFKNTSNVRACQIDDDFFVETKNGRLSGKRGDYLMITAGGLVFPCSKALFEADYSADDWKTSALVLLKTARDLMSFDQFPDPGVCVEMNKHASTIASFVGEDSEWTAGWKNMIEVLTKAVNESLTKNQES